MIKEKPVKNCNENYFHLNFKTYLALSNIYVQILTYPPDLEDMHHSIETYIFWKIMFVNKQKTVRLL